MSDYYYKEFCPKCNTKNWFTGSHYDGDDSKSDPSPIHECFKCHYKYINSDDVVTIEDAEEFIKHYGDYDLGKETIE
jgi:hypothetical protein